MTASILNRMARQALAPAFLASLLFMGAGAQAAPPDYAAILAAPDRTEADRQTDQRRDPLELLAFTGAAPGMKVLDMGAGAGYSTELMARAVAPNGTVYGQDSPANVEKIVKDRFDARAKTPAMKNVVRLVRDYDDPVPADLHDLDLITFFFAYHDVSATKTDLAAMNNKMLGALKPGGVLVIADYSARPGDGVSVANTLHRIEENTLRLQVEAAGFKFVQRGNFLSHPDDPRDAPIFRSKTPVDQFVLKFQKPR